MQHAAAYRLKHIYIYIYTYYIIEQEGRFTYFKGFSIHFGGVQKPFNKVNMIFNLCCGKIPGKRNNRKPHIASPKSAWNDVFLLALVIAIDLEGGGRSFGEVPTIGLRLKASLASLAAQQDGEASEDIAALVGAAEMQAVCVCVFFSRWGGGNACNIRPRKKMMWNPQNGGLLRFGRWEPFLLNPFALGNWNGFNDASSWNGWKWLDIWKVATIESWIVLYRVHWDCHFGGTLCFLRFSPQLLDRMFWAVDK